MSEFLKLSSIDDKIVRVRKVNVESYTTKK